MLKKFILISIGLSGIYWAVLASIYPSILSGYLQWELANLFITGVTYNDTLESWIFFSEYKDIPELDGLDKIKILALIVLYFLFFYVASTVVYYIKIMNNYFYLHYLSIEHLISPIYFIVIFTFRFLLNIDLEYLDFSDTFLASEEYGSDIPMDLDEEDDEKTPKPSTAQSSDEYIEEDVDPNCEHGEYKHREKLESVGNCECPVKCSNDELEPDLMPELGHTCCTCDNKADFFCGQCDCTYCKDCVENRNNK